MSRKKRSKISRRHKMVGWYDPIQLGRTAVEVLLSTIFGRHADKRIMQALADPGELHEKKYYEVGHTTTGDFWFDYISDVGDGFDSTYSMAYHITRPELILSSKPGGPKETDSKPFKTFRGETLILGGDEVYPTASRQVYTERLTSLYDAVFPYSRSRIENSEATSSPTIFAVPGNHDWYDSLVAFSDIFCSDRKFAGWQTVQNRSYFAVKLPHNWWLFGTDMQLGSSLDKSQIAYFTGVMKDVAAEDRIILCNAEPHWITAKMYEDDSAYNNRNMGYFEGRILRGQVAIYIAGDRHYYRRHELIKHGKTRIDKNAKNKAQKFVAGGGGAFLHPTHKEDVETIGRRDIYELQKSYPDQTTSARLTFWNLLFPILNWRFGILTGFLYLLTAQAFLVDLGRFSLNNLPGAIGTVVSAALIQPLALFWVVLLFGGFLLFTDTHSKPYRLIAGPIHAVFHLLALFFIGWAAAYFVGEGIGLSSRTLPQLFMVAAIIFIGGAIVGPFIMGIYLFVSLNIFGRHHNEAFSSLRIADFKNFLRFKIDADTGNLTIYPVGVDRVVKKWKPGDVKSGEPELIPNEVKPENRPFLIEAPITFEIGFDAKRPVKEDLEPAGTPEEPEPPVKSYAI